MASIRASVSLLRMQSISCLCDLSLELSKRRRTPSPLRAVLVHILGKARRPSNRRTNSRSTSLIVSSTQRSSPLRAFWIASSRFERSRSCRRETICVLLGSKLGTQSHFLSGNDAWVKSNHKLATASTVVLVTRVPMLACQISADSERFQKTRWNLYVCLCCSNPFNYAKTGPNQDPKQIVTIMTW